MRADETKGFWRGRRIEEFTKEELIDIVIEMHQMMQEDYKTHRGDLRVLAGLPRER